MLRLVVLREIFIYKFFNFGYININLDCIKVKFDTINVNFGRIKVKIVIIS